MAIIVEEEKNKSNLTSLFGWFIIIVAIAAAGYYLFIASPPPTVITPPAGFSDISAITQITFDPSSVINSSGFTALQQTVAEPTSTGPVAIGRPNPFIAP